MSPMFEITIRVRVRALDSDEAQEQAFALCNMLSPAPSEDVGSPPDVTEISFNAKADLRRVGFLEEP